MKNHSYLRAFLPYALAAFLVGIVGGFSTVLGPAFVRDIGIDYSNTTWTALSQAISTAACAPALGKLCDALGRRRTLLLGLSVFTLGNFLTVPAGSLIAMMVARFIVGMGTAAITPVILSYIATEFPADAVASGFSLYMLISSASVVFGPTLGALMTESFGWRGMIFVCCIISTAVFLACLLLDREKAAIKRSAFSNFDTLGSGCILLFFGLVLCIPSFGQNFGWTSVPFLVVLALSAITLPVLVLAERRAAVPILQANFLARRRFILPILALFLTQGLMQANMTNTIIFVNYTRPENTLISGYAISILYLGMSLGSIIAGPLADKREPKNILTATFLLTGAGCALMLLFSEYTSTLLLAASLGILGFGLGGNGAIFMKIVLSDLSGETAGAGTGIYGLFRDLAAPFGVAVFVPMFTNQVSNFIESGAFSAPAAAVRSVHLLSITELICVGIGIIVVRLLPSIHPE